MDDSSDNNSPSPNVTNNIPSVDSVKCADPTKTLNVYFANTVSDDARFNGMMTGVFKNCFSEDIMLAMLVQLS
jgi:hypothetical protein